MGRRSAAAVLHLVCQSNNDAVACDEQNRQGRAYKCAASEALACVLPLLCTRGEDHDAEAGGCYRPMTGGKGPPTGRRALGRRVSGCVSELLYEETVVDQRRKARRAATPQRRRSRGAARRKAVAWQ